VQYYQQDSLTANPPVSLQPVDPNFYINQPFPLPPLPGYACNPNGLLPTMISMRSDGSLASSPGLVPNDSTKLDMQKIGSSSSLQSVSPVNFQMNPMNFSTSSPLLTQATSPYNLVAPQQVFLPQPVSPRFTTPSASPQPPFMEPGTVFFAPSPLLLTPQQSTSSVNSDSTNPDMPFPVGHTFTLFPPTQSFTSSRTPDRTYPTHISPARSPQPERPTTQTAFRERPMSQPDQSHRSGYPPKPTTSYQSEVVPEEPVANKRQKKFGYRSKQRKIDRTHRNIQEKFSSLGLFAAERELVRGDDTLRIHVKTFEGLTDIQTALSEIHNHKEIEIVRVAAVFSKKNRFQKKGFIVYLKVGSVPQVEIALRLLKRYSTSLRNVAIAKAKSPAKGPSNEAHKVPEDAKATSVQFFPEVPIPRRLSATAM